MLSSGLYEQAINTALNREFSEIPDAAKIYHKLVRDRIPEIIEADRKSMSVKRFLTRTIYIF